MKNPRRVAAFFLLARPAEQRHAARVSPERLPRQLPHRGRAAARGEGRGPLGAPGERALHLRAPLRAARRCGAAGLGADAGEALRQHGPCAAETRHALEPPQRSTAHQKHRNGKY